MELQSDGIFIGQRSLGESQQITKVFSKDYGLISGVTRFSTNPKRGAVFQLGDHIRVRWRARLEDHLGQCVLERQAEQYVSQMEISSTAMQALMSLSSLLQLALNERETEDWLYATTLELLRRLSSPEWVYTYVEWERVFLESMGFGLDISSCAADCPAQDLTYISPKSGRAVCAIHGLPYKDQLFLLPKCWKADSHTQSDRADMVAALHITGHFLSREIFPSGEAMPEFRRNLLENLMKKP